MSTVRDVIKGALRLLRAAAAGDDPTADELGVGLGAVQDLILAIHEARGPLLVIDITGDYTPGENQRLRVQAGYTVSITLPNSVAIFGSFDPYDYGFDYGAWTNSAANPPLGSTGGADGIAWRQPTDGARIEVVGTQQGLWFYRGDINAWTPALGLSVDSELPFNARLTSDLTSLVAEQTSDMLSEALQLSPVLKARIARARAAIFSQTGARQAPVRASYL